MAGKTDFEKAQSWIDETLKLHRSPNPDLKRVVAGYRKGLKYNPGSPEGHYFLGVAYLGLRQFAQALEEFDTALQLKPDFPDVHFHRAQAFINLRKFSEAAASLEEALKHNPQASPVLYSLGYVNQVLKDYNKADKYFSRAYKANPQDKPGLLQYVLYLNSRGRGDESLGVCDQFLAKFPADREILNLRAMTLLGMGKADEARELLESLVEKFPGDATLHFNLGQVHEQAKNIAAARGQFVKTAELQPKYQPVYQRLISLELRDKNFPEAMVWVDKGLEQYPRDPALLYWQAVVWTEQKDYSRAEEQLRRLLEEYPRYREAQVALQRLYQLQGKVGRSEEEIRKDLEKRPEDSGLWRELGKTLLLSRDFSGAAEAFAKAEKSYAGDAEFLADYGTALVPLSGSDPGKGVEAERVLLKSLEIQPLAPRVVYQLARLALNRLDPETALKHAERYRKIEKTDSAVLNVMGIAATQRGFPREALDFFRRSWDLQQAGNMEALVNLAQLSDFVGNYEPAEEYYRKWAEMVPQDITPLARLGYMQARKQDFAKALESYDQALERDPNDAGVHFLRGLTLKDLGRTDEALEALRKALEIRPDYGEASFYLQQFERNRPLGITTIEELEAAVEEDPENYDDRYLLGHAYLDARRFSEAAEQLEQVVQADPGNHQALIRLVDALAAEEKYDRAIDHLIDLEEKFPQDAGLRYRLAELLEANGEVESAVKEFRNALTLMPNNVNFLFRLGVALINSDKEEKGEEYLRKAVAAQENFPQAWFELAKLEMTTDREESALKHFDRAYQQNRNLVEALYYQGLIQRNFRKDRTQAVRLFRAVLGSRYEYGDAHFQLGELLREEDPRTALRHLQTALEQWPEDHFNRERAQELVTELQSRES